MGDTRMLLACALAAFTTAAAIFVLRRVAEPLGLVDRPNDRKHHVGEVPLIGGLAMITGLLVGAVWYGRFHYFAEMLLGTSVVLAVVGTLDDRHDLSVRVRLAVQIASILTVIATTGVYIHTLGHIFGYQLELGWLGIPLTVAAVIGLLNAFNMMDGIDGLAGGLTLVSIGAIALFTRADPLHGMLVLMALLATAVLPYLAVNMGFLGRKIFMGDAGSMVVGYLLAWSLIRLSQSPRTHLSPVDVLWCVALPVLDTLAVMYRRLREGQSPFKPDRGHIHHILLRAGLSPRAALITLVALAAAVAILGNVASSLGAGTGSNLAAFCILMCAYIATVTRVWARQEARHVQAARPLAANDPDITLIATARYARLNMVMVQSEKRNSIAE
jgi:UDP-GlcNAc:undecaprenyl-phosphate/decaprenyl-phosphate GlcNAc-1-phosphate transferase